MNQGERLGTPVLHGGRGQAAVQTSQLHKPPLHAPEPEGPSQTHPFSKATLFPIKKQQLGRFSPFASGKQRKFPYLVMRHVLFSEPVPLGATSTGMMEATLREFNSGALGRKE